MARAALVGQRIRKRRQELGRSQSALAGDVGISASYLNLIEHNKRPIGGALLNRLAAAIELDSGALAGTEEARLIAELGEVAADAASLGVDLTPADAGEVVASSPRAARAILGLFRAYREARMRSDLLGERLGEDSFVAEASHQILALITTIRSYAEILKDYGDLSAAERRGFVSTLVEESETLAERAGDMFDFMGGRGARRPRASPREAVEDFIADQANYFPQLEDAAERIVAGLRTATPSPQDLARHLKTRFGVAVARRPVSEVPAGGARLEGAEFLMSETLAPSSQRFRLAHLIGTLACGDLLDRLVDSAALPSGEVSARLRVALANYFAGALTMPYAPFREATDELRYDVMRLGQRFDASFEQVCHRLTTLRRPGAEGLPLHFVRTDIAGNLSKRFSASGLRLPRYGGACPRWIVHHAFASPGRIVTQIAQLPGGETFFFIARAGAPDAAVGVPATYHAVMIGCAIEHAHRLVYADGLDLGAPAGVVPVGITCRQCARDDCAQRAFDRTPLPGASAAGDTHPADLYHLANSRRQQAGPDS